MVTLAYLGHRLNGQLSGNPEGLAGVDVVWQGTAPDVLMRSKMSDNLSVLVAELEALGEEPVQKLKRIKQKCRPELTLVLHHFAKRDLLSSLLEGNTRTLQAPVSLSSLRSQMLSLIVRDMLSPESADPAAARPKAPGSTSLPTQAPNPTSVCPQCGAALADSTQIAN